MMDTSQTYPTTAYPPPSYAVTEPVITTTMVDEQQCATFPQDSAYVCQPTTSTGAVLIVVFDSCI